MFLLSSGLSRFIRRDSFRCNLNLLFSFKRIVKSSKLASWPFSKMRSKIFRSSLLLDYWSRDTFNSIFQKRVWGQFLHHILCMIFKCFSCYILLTDHISLSDCLYFSRYWAMCVLQLFANHAVKSQKLKLTSYFWSNRFAI